MEVNASSPQQLWILLKAPVAGTVKTRLAGKLGHAAACEAYQALVKHLLKNLKGLRQVVLCYSPPEQASLVNPWLIEGWGMHPQSEGNLGERLASTLQTGFNSGAKKMVIIGSDCPYVQTSDIREAWKQLDSHDAVVGPAIDGGYWLIGMKEFRPELLENISWSTNQVLGQTLKRCKERQLKVHLLRILEDVDDLGSWQRFLSETGAALRNP